MKSRWSAILRLRCPRCLEGAIYASFLRPHPTCPDCGLDYLRESGYDIGSYYFSYALGAISGMPLAVYLMYLRVPAVPFMLVLALQIGLVSPFLVRWSRALWYHFDQYFDPR